MSKQLIATGGGIVLDTPPHYALHREQTYRDWIVDAIQWTRNHGYLTVVIISPHDSGLEFAQHTANFVQFLKSNDVMPAIFVGENYTPSAPPDYPNVVGNEKDPNTILGICLSLIERTF